MRKFEIIRKDDLADCAKIFVEVFNNQPWNENWSISVAHSRFVEISNTPGFVGLKVEDDNQITGFAMGYLENFEVGRDYFLKEMCVIPEIQGKGVGSALLDELTQKLISLGARRIYLLTSKNGVTENFYTKNGFCRNEIMVMMGRSLEPKI